MSPAPCIIAVTGLRAEARIARGAEVLVLSGGGDSAGLARSLEAAIAAADKIAGIISFGIAGGLTPALPPGSKLIGRSIIAPDGQRFPANEIWSKALAQALGAAEIADLAGADAPVAGRNAKTVLYRQTGARAVDMESHTAARIALAHRLPFAALRVITDSAETDLPPAARIGMRPDGKIALGAIIGSLLSNPGQIPALCRTALDARAAFAALLSSRQAVGERFCIPDFR